MMQPCDIPFHPIADIFPLLDGQGYKDLIEDIREHGLRHPIMLFEDKILDGRNRFRACQAAEVSPAFETFRGSLPEAVAFVWSENIHRRHMESGQIAAAWKKRELIEGSHEAQVKAKVEAEAKEKQREHGETAPGRAKSLVQTFEQVTDDKEKNPMATRTIEHRAKAAGTNRQYMADIDVIHAKKPELVDEILHGRTSIPKAKKTIHKLERESERKQAIESLSQAAKTHIDVVCDIRQCSMQELLSSDIQPDCLITDPPYPKEYLSLFGELAWAAKDIPLVAVMCGQTYLPEIMAMMCAHLPYRWTIAYLTPGGQSVQQWPCKINTFWKPILLFGAALDWVGDVTRSDVNDNDKRFHEWGQSESGMADVIDRLSKPGDLICDPFCGGGTTAVVCMRLGRRFVGCDIDHHAVMNARERCQAFFGEQHVALS